MKYYGSLEQLQTAVRDCAIAGRWDYRDEHKFHDFRSRSGEVINWWPKTGTLSLQGRSNAGLEKRLMQLAYEQKLPLLKA